MPWHVAKSSKCPSSKPWAVIKDSDGSVMGCHVSEESAMEQMKALHINESNQSPMEKERRYIIASDLRAADDNGLTIAGHAAVFNQLSLDLGNFREKIRPGAFADTIKKDRVVALWNHEPGEPLASNDSGTLHLREDNTGLFSEIRMVATDTARKIFELVRAHVIRHMSFGFLMAREDEIRTFQDDGTMLRELVRVTQLFDVSPVTFPAYPQTDLATRSYADKIIAEAHSENNIKPIKGGTEAETFLYRLKLRNEFLERCKSFENPLSYESIIRSAQKKYLTLGGQNGLRR